MSQVASARRLPRERAPVVRPVVTYESQQRQLARRLESMARLYEARGARELAASAAAEARAALAALLPITQESLDREIAGLRALEAKHADMLTCMPPEWAELPE